MTGSYAASMRGRIVAQARTVFLRDGITTTRLEDLACSMGVSRQTLHRHVGGRQGLLSLMIVECVREISAEIQAVPLSDALPLMQAVTEWLAGGIELTRGCAEFELLANALPRDRLNTLFADEASPISAIAHELFTPLLRRAASEGALRTDVTWDGMVQWLAEMFVLLVPRLDLDDGHLRTKISDFALRGVFV